MNFILGQDLPGRNFKLNEKDRFTCAINVVRGKAGQRMYS